MCLWVCGVVRAAAARAAWTSCLDSDNGALVALDLTGAPQEGDFKLVQACGQDTREGHVSLAKEMMSLQQ